MKKLILSAVAAAAVLAPQLASAESDINIVTPGPTSATARLDFQIVIPRVLFLQVGTSAALFTDATTISALTATVPAANVANGTNVTFAGGDVGSGVVNVRVFGNNGNIALTAASNLGTALLTSGTDTLPWSEILVTSAAGAGGAGFTGTSIAHPTINGAGVTINATSKVVRQHGTWAFVYDNSQAYAAGTYGAGTLANGRVTYTATLP
jgi:hypothetical protein